MENLKVRIQYRDDSVEEFPALFSDIIIRIPQPRYRSHITVLIEDTNHNTVKVIASEAILKNGELKINDARLIEIIKATSKAATLTDGEPIKMDSISI